MSLVLNEEDLLADISRDELDGLAKSVIETGQADPIATNIKDALEFIRMYIEPLKVQEDVVKRIWRLLAIGGLYNRLSVMPEKREAERDWCLKTLTQIRDGKFPNLMLDPEVTPVPHGACGGNARVRFNLGGSKVV